MKTEKEIKREYMQEWRKQKANLKKKTLKEPSSILFRQATITINLQNNRLGRKILEESQKKNLDPAYFLREFLMKHFNLK